MQEIPVENIEAENLAKRLKLNKYRFTHIGNESGQSGSKNIIIMMSRKKRMGVSKGFPDFCIVLKRGSLLFIELKRQKKILKNGNIGESPSIISKEQEERIEELNNIDNISACICYGFRNAMDKIIELENL